MSDVPPPPPSQPPPPPQPPPGSFGPPQAPPPPQQPGYAQQTGYPQPGYPPQHGYAQPGQPQPASFGARLGAVLLDGLIVSLFAVPAIIALFAGPTEIQVCNVDASGDITISDDEAVRSAFCEVPTGTTWAIFGLLMTAAVVGGLVYYIRGEGRGQTVGKRAVGIRVADANTGEPIGSGRAFIRYLGRIPSSFFALGYLWMLWDDRSQTWHDKMATSVVVKD